jgi:hypothetical protein
MNLEGSLSNYVCSESIAQVYSNKHNLTEAYLPNDQGDSFAVIISHAKESTLSTYCVVLHFSNIEALRP